MTPQVRTQPHRYSNSNNNTAAAATTDDAFLQGANTAAGAGAVGALGGLRVNSSGFRALPGIDDALDLEMSKLDVHKTTAALGHEAAVAAAAAAGRGSRRSNSGGVVGGGMLPTATYAQQRLLLANSAAGIGAAAAAAAAGGLDWADYS